MLNRTCVKEYQIPGTEKFIEKGTEVYISVLGLHRDEEFYERPNEFNPVRLSEEIVAGKNLVNRPYLPFGDGNRNCIGNISTRNWNLENAHFVFTFNVRNL